MKRSLLAAACVAFSCGTLAHDDAGRSDDGYTIQSLNTPDPIFTASRQPADPGERTVERGAA